MIKAMPVTGKLLVELVPQSSWFDNVRSRVSKAQWDKLRKRVYAEAQFRCDICEESGVKLSAHEVWGYDDKTNTQTLLRLQALCSRCHDVKHFGLSEMRGLVNQCFAHLQKVNHWTKPMAIKHVQQAAEQWQQRSQKDWIVDIAILETYGIQAEALRRKP